LKGNPLALAKQGYDIDDELAFHDHCRLAAFADYADKATYFINPLNTSNASPLKSFISCFEKDFLVR
jgi:hypothetical protein